MIGTHDWVLVILSVVIAMMASFTALDLAGRIRASVGHARRAWLATAALAMGGGIWSMHFVAMLAYSMPGMAVSYDLALTLLSLLIPVAVTGIAFGVMNSRTVSVPILVAAGLFMGLGVVAMHYCGMAAMRMPASLRYDRLWVAISVLIAIGAATAALWLAAKNNDIRQRIIAAIVMGLAISGMHFAGMKAATFNTRNHVDLATRGSDLSQTSLAINVSAATLLILFLALIAAMFDRRFAHLAAREAAALRQSEERYRSLYRGTPLPLHSIDENGCIEHVSDAWLRLTGYTREEVVGRAFVNFLTDASVRQALQSDRPELLTHGILEDREYRIITKNGDIRDVVASAHMERDDEGNFLHVVGGLTDVTDRKRAEEALVQAQKIEAIGHLTGGIAHDFNNLLAVIIGNLDLLGRQLTEGSRAQRLVDNAMEGAKRGASLTQRLLAFARRQDLRPESVDVAELVRGMSEMLERSLGPQVRVNTQFPLRLPAAHVDAHQLELAILNMAVNARDAMPTGGTLTVSATEDFLPITAANKAGRFVRIAIADDGLGMDAETLAHASEPFFTTKGVGKGTGLGLSMVQGLAAQSGGTLQIDSAPDEGTTVILWLPVADARRPAVVLASTAEAPKLPPLSLLAVDDDELVLRNTAAMLEDLGHSVLTALSGVEALKQLSRVRHFDVLITDQMMPNMTGVQLAAAVKERHPHLPILLVSGFSELAPDDAGSFEYLHKPFDQAALAAALARAYAGGKVVRIDERRPASSA